MSLNLCRNHQALVFHCVQSLSVASLKESRASAQMLQEVPNGAAGDCYLNTFLSERKAPFSLKANQNATSPLLPQLILLFFYSNFSSAHMKCEAIALNILASLAE